MADASDSLLETSALTVTVPGRTLVDNLDLSLARGEVVAVLGKNGTGKSLTLLTLAGLRAPQSGNVLLGGSDLFASPRAAVARRLALLPQSVDDIFPATVLDTAMIGRHPHIAPLAWESARDRDIAMTALRQMDIADLAGRDVLTLSGGERRRLAVAQALAQTPDIYLLDEPTNHLDPQHQIDVLDVFRRAADSGAAVLVSLHDANLATRYADRCLLLFGDGRWRLGDVGDVLDESHLQELYGTPIEAVPWRDTRLFVATGGGQST